jgi:hypothetical protein
VRETGGAVGAVGMDIESWYRKQEEVDRKTAVVVGAELVPRIRERVGAAHEAESSYDVLSLNIRHRDQNLVFCWCWRCVWVVVELGPVAVPRDGGVGRGEAHAFAGESWENMHLQEAADAKSLTGIVAITLTAAGDLVVPLAEWGLAGQRTRGPDSGEHKCRHRTWLLPKTTIRRKQKRDCFNKCASLGSPRFMIGRLVCRSPF